MAFTYGFYNSVNHDRKYDAVQMGQIFDGIITDGIYATYLKAMVVKASSNASEVIVQPGRAWFNHTWSYNDADYPVAAPEPEVVLDRIDTLVLDINAEDASRTNSFLWVQGTPTSQIPEPPALIHTATHNQYPLCDVYRQAGTTQIYAADITNRVGTSDCPFVTGVLEGIDIDDLLAQWDNEFHTWENATKASFEGWMVNQQAVYTAWWDALKVQMAGDVADVEAWIATIHDILDEEVATRLQAEIDEIKTELPSGSHITVTTTDTELYSRTVTITDEANHTVTSQFDATGVAVFKTVPYVGNLTISSTDGTRTATAVVQTPYFARYSFSIAFWSATVNIDGTSELGGETVSITDSSLALVGTVVLNASGLGVFNATYPDTYKFSVTHGGETMSVTLEVSQETTYNVEIHGGFNWQRWVTLGGLDSTDYSSLSDVFTDEEAVRRLMLVHASANYLIDAVSNRLSEIDDFVANDTAMKWIGLCDYVCDGLTAITGVEAKLLASTYWERYLKDHVPVMTSNTAPYGEVVYSGTSTGHDGRAPYKAFDGAVGDMNRWLNSPANTSGQYLGYKFTSPICVRMISLYCVPSQEFGAFDIQASSDGINWIKIGEGSYTSLDAGEKTYTFSNTNYYSYYRIIENTNTVAARSIYTLQFYGRQLSVSVPVMTSNTAPFGEASGANIYSGDYYKAFDNDDTTYASFPSGTSRLLYKFTNPINPKRIVVWNNQSSASDVSSYKVIASNDGSNFVTIDTFNEGIATKRTHDLATDNYYLYVGIEITASSMGAYVSTLQFYGLDYSEKEFEAGTTKKWLYDHGVELEEITAYKVRSTDIVEKQSNRLYAKRSGGGANNLVAFYANDVSLNAYNLLRAKFGDEMSTTSTEYVYLSASTTPQAESNSAYKLFNTTNLPTSQYNACLDISSVNGGDKPRVHYTSDSAQTNVFTVTELWVE